MRQATRRIVDGLALLAFLPLAADFAAAQERPRWSWPEPQNLQSLPEDFTPERLRAVMTGFTRALGVGCEHCHVGEAGRPLTEFDFVSDDNPNKSKARTMLALLGMVNDKLEEIEPSGQRVNMWCHTCHRGLPRPQTLAEVLAEAAHADGQEAALARFKELREEYYGTGSYDFSELSLLRTGIELFGAGYGESALELMKLNVEYNPESADAVANLGRAYARLGDTETALVHLDKALEMDPENFVALDKLRELRPAEERSEKPDR